MFVDMYNMPIVLTRIDWPGDFITRKTIAILEDNDRRIAAMRLALAQATADYSVVIYEKAADMISWLRENMAEVALLSLDYDLPVMRTPDGQVIDYGTGGEVAEFVAKQPPAFPIIIHSSNPVGVVQMEQHLNRQGWPTTRVYPEDDLAWIAGVWIFDVRESLRK